MACGHKRAAVRNGMAECTPNLRAAYDAADTTPRSFGRPPTTTGRPLSAGSNNSSTDTKNASMSTWKMVFMRLRSLSTPGYATLNKHETLGRRRNTDRHRRGIRLGVRTDAGQWACQTETLFRLS